MWGLSHFDIGVIFGAFGGLLRHIVFTRRLNFPRKVLNTDRRWIGQQLGVFREILVGAGAGVVLVEGSHVPAVVLAILGGFGGATLLILRAHQLMGADEAGYNADKVEQDIEEFTEKE